MVDDAHTVLVVEPDPETLDRYVGWLDRHYEVTTATSGETALDVAEGADVVLLDRRIPDRSGDEVAADLFERPDAPMVAMLSTVDPDLDIVDLACDEYLLKPLSQSELSEAVTRLVRRADYDERLATYSSLASKRATLESAVPMDELLANPEYDALCRRTESLRRELDGLVGQFEKDDFEAAFRALGTGENGG